MDFCAGMEFGLSRNSGCCVSSKERSQVNAVD